MKQKVMCKNAFTITTKIKVLSLVRIKPFYIDFEHFQFFVLVKELLCESSKVFPKQIMSKVNLVVLNKYFLQILLYIYLLIPYHRK